MKMRQLFILFAMLGALMLSATACKNTAHGVGQDVEDAGDAIKDATN